MDRGHNEALRGGAAVPQPGPKAVLVFYAAAAVALGTIALGASFSNRPPSDFTCDPLWIGKMPFYVGAVSHLSALGWSSGAAVSLFSAWTMYLLGQSAGRIAFLAAMGALTGWLTIDDLFMVHDQIFPMYLGVPEVVEQTGSIVITVALLAAFGRVIRHTPYALLFVAGLLFAASLFCDFNYGDYNWYPMLEDGLKLMGIAGWTGYLTITSARWFIEHDMR